MRFVNENVAEVAVPDVAATVYGPPVIEFAVKAGAVAIHSPPW